MDRSEFWRQLAQEFFQLPDPHGGLWAQWDYVIGSHALGRWEIRGTRDLISQFEPLARRGAMKLSSRRAPDLLDAWLEALRVDGDNFKFIGTGDHIDGDRVVVRTQHGTISRLCQSSANYCKKLESTALQREYEESLPNDTQSSKPPDDAPIELGLRASEPSNEAEIERRQRMLAEYKAATGSSNKQIYEAQNSGLHKPQFYEWIKAKLPAQSSTTINFERFLSEKKPPIKRSKS